MWNEAGNKAARPQRGAGDVWQESPLVGVRDLLKTHQERASKAFSLTERPFCDLVSVRGDARDPAFAAALERVTGCRPPSRPNTVARGQAYDVLWLGPDEWLVRSHAAQAATLEAQLVAALAGQFASAVDIGSGYTVLELAGTKAREVLTRGCPLDLHPRLFAQGQCAQSHYFKASIVLIATGADTFEVVVRRSFADYFCRIMLDAAAPLAS
jgi:sarcosine oxidase subunit gamma